jgi:hypothetical protein
MKVWPKNDEIRKMLVHPQGRIPFRDEGPADWPDDSFTYRRVQDGDITTEEPKAEEPKASSKVKAPETK